MGRAKAWLPFGDEVLLQRVVRRISEAAAPVVVVAAAGQDVPELPASVTVVVDAITGRGPLQGLLAGLEAMGTRAEAVFASSTDAPFLHPELVRRLDALRREGGHDVVVPRVSGHYHALSAVYARSVRRPIATLLDAGRLRLSGVLERVNTLVAEEELLLADPALRTADPRLDSLRNMNTPEEYASALRDAGFG